MIFKGLVKILLSVIIFSFPLLAASSIFACPYGDEVKVVKSPICEQTCNSGIYQQYITFTGYADQTTCREVHWFSDSNCQTEAAQPTCNNPTTFCSPDGSNGPQCDIAGVCANTKKYTNDQVCQGTQLFNTTTQRQEGGPGNWCQVINCGYACRPGTTANYSCGDVFAQNGVNLWLPPAANGVGVYTPAQQTQCESDCKNLSCTPDTPTALKIVTPSNLNDFYSGTTTSAGRIVLGWEQPKTCAAYNIRIDDGVNTTKDSRNNCGPHYLCIDRYTGTNISTTQTPYIVANQIKITPVGGRRFTFWVHGLGTDNYLTPSSQMMTFTIPPPPLSNPQANVTLSQTVQTISQDASKQQAQLKWSVGNGSGGYTPVSDTDYYVVKILDITDTANWNDNCSTLSTDTTTIPKEGCFKALNQGFTIPVAPSHRYKWSVRAFSTAAGFGPSLYSEFSSYPPQGGPSISVETPVKCGSYSTVTWGSIGAAKTIKVIYKDFNGYDPVVSAPADANGFVTLAVTASGTYKLWIPGPKPVQVYAISDIGGSYPATINCTTGSVSPPGDGGGTNTTFHKLLPLTNSTTALFRDNILFQWEPYSPPTGQPLGVYHLIVCSNGPGLNCIRAIDTWTSATSFLAEYKGPTDYGGASGFPNTLRNCQNGSNGLCFNGNYSWQVYWSPSQNFSAVAFYGEKGWQSIASASDDSPPLLTKIKKWSGL